MEMHSFVASGDRSIKKVAGHYLNWGAAMRSAITAAALALSVMASTVGLAQTDVEKAVKEKEAADAQKATADAQKAAADARKAAADARKAAADSRKDAADAEKAALDSEKKLELEKLGGFKFGVALGVERYREAYVNQAETDGPNRVVRVSDSQKVQPSLWLETHYLWDGIAASWKLTHSAPGFYIGVRAFGPGSETFDAFSLGLMWAFKRKAIGAETKDQIAESINIGIGPVWHRTRVLANGIEEGKPLPADFQDIKYDKKDETSWMIMISVGF